MPKLGPEGSCARVKEIEDEPYNLAADIFGLEISPALAAHAQTTRLYRLNRVVQEIQKLTGVEWFGIYRKIEGETSSIHLVSAPAFQERAETPLSS